MVRKPNRDILRERTVTVRVHHLGGRWVGVVHAHWKTWGWWHTTFSYGSESDCRAAVKLVRKQLKRGQNPAWLLLAPFSGDLKDIRARAYEERRVA